MTSNDLFLYLFVSSNLGSSNNLKSQTRLSDILKLGQSIIRCSRDVDEIPLPISFKMFVSCNFNEVLKYDSGSTF